MIEYVEINDVLIMLMKLLNNYNFIGLIFLCKYIKCVFYIFKIWLWYGIML